MMSSMLPDGREPVPTTSGSAVTRRERSGDAAATRAAGDEGAEGRAFADAGAAPRAFHCAGTIYHHQKDEPAPPSAHADVIR